MSGRGRRRPTSPLALGTGSAAACQTHWGSGIHRETAQSGVAPHRRSKEGRVRIWADMILRPSVISVVTSKPTNVVTRAIPPSKYGAFCVAILVISGSKIVVDAVKIQTATTNARPLMANPVKSTDATSSASALAKSDKAIRAKNVSIRTSSPICFRSTDCWGD